jgi:dTDP-4-dehydrorhamnose reductase
VTTRWLVTGAAGMLGHDLLDVLAQRRPDDPVTPTDVADLDITNADAVAAAVGDADVVVNCAAWTDVDGAESNEAAAFRINAVGPQVLARACAAADTRLLHISTDYVFDGTATTPYPEDAPANPASAYGRTKAAGEWAVGANAPHHAWILRTAWLYGWHGRSFIATILRLADERETLDVVADQRGQPTWTVDLGNRIVDTVESSAGPGVYHATSSGETTWYGLARTVFEHQGLDPDRVRPTTSDAFPRPAPRPAYSVLGHEAWIRAGMSTLRPWDDGLQQALNQRSHDRG